MDILHRTICEEYGQILNLLGNGCASVLCYDGSVRHCKIRPHASHTGARKKRRIGGLKKIAQVNAIVLVRLPLEFGIDLLFKKGDIIHIYKDDEVKVLRKEGAIPPQIIQEEDDVSHDVLFDYSEDENDDAVDRVPYDKKKDLMETLPDDYDSEDDNTLLRINGTLSHLLRL